MVEGTTLEMWQWGNPFVSSNLTVSAKIRNQKKRTKCCRASSTPCGHGSKNQKFSLVGEPTKNGKEIFGLTLPSISSLYIINHDGIFHNRLYHAIISMATKYRVKYQKLIERLRQARLDAGLTQVEAGKKLKKPQAYISKIERGERRIDAVEMDELAKLYGKPLDYFVK